MSHSLFQTTLFAMSSLLYSWLCFRGGIFLRRQQHYHKDSRIIDYLGLSRRSFDLESWAIAILSGLGLAPFLPVIMALLLWRGNGFFIFNWVGWASISLVGLLSILWGLFWGKNYLEQYWKAVDAVKMEDIVPASSEFPHLEFSKFQNRVLDLAFKGIDSQLALAAAKATWRYS